MLFPIVSALFLLASALYVLLDLQLIRGLRKLDSDPDAKPEIQPFITVLIAARNEEANLPRVLDALLAQDYPKEKTQIIVVNDRSSDNTESILRKYAGQNPGLVEFLTVSSPAAGRSPKKHALLQGLEIARGEWIATTDADCVMGPKWLSALSGHFAGRTGMVLGFTGYEEPARGFGWGQGAQALEFVSYGVVSSSLVGLGFPVIANANNLAYRREAFDQASAIWNHAHIVSGDDDFLLQSIHATGKWNTKYCVSPDALMFTAPPDSWKHFWEQRKRWASKTALYGSRQVVFLSLIFVFYAAIPVFLISGLRHKHWAELGAALFAIKTLADFLVMREGLKTFRLSALLRFFPLTALMHVPLLIAAVVAGTFGGFTWKGQKFSSTT